MRTPAKWCLVFTLALALSAFRGVPVGAETDVNESVLSSRTSQKTVTYVVLSTLSDFAYGAAVTGHLATGGILAALSALTEPLAYYLHEAAWNGLAGPSNGNIATLPSRTVTYGTVNAGRAFVLGMMVTGNVAFSTAFVAFEVISDSLAYTLNDVAWAHFPPTQ